jgi:hypothetical protein
MRRTVTALIILVYLSLNAGNLFSQQRLVTAEKKQKLEQLSATSKANYASKHRQAMALAKKHNWVTVRKTRNGGVVSLQGVNAKGFPVYLITHDNIISAATTNTNAVQPGGSLGLNLSGSSAFLQNKLAIWDGGSVYKQHQEFAGKTITWKDTSSIIDHATHVSGTMLARGAYPPVKGMAFNASTLISYDFNNDIAEMSAEAPNLLLSNHSYGDEAGWIYDDAYGRWEWFGLPGDTVDYAFGFYNERTQAFDQIAYNAPYYLIVESAGNARASTGPAVGDDYYGYKSASDPSLVDKGPRPATISSNSAYETISTTGNAKNILTIGAINPLPNGPANSQSISTTYFSSWGPTNDGRVKPDLVANGLNVLSCGSANPTEYILYSGTSQSAPNVTGSLYLLQEYYAEKHSGNFMLAATLKGLACHTAFDGGNSGPDYIYGWGLLNTKAAAQAITDNGTKSLIKESSLSQGQIQTYNVVASGNGPLMATISWTDPPGDTTKTGVINDRTPKLVNDLDIRITDGKTTFMPWVLNPNNPSAPATTGDNIRDNVEQVYIPGAIPGRSYTITVSHKGTLKSGSQDYSLIATGVGGAAYCVSGPLSGADSRINNVTLSNVNNTPSAGCTTFSDYTNLTVQLEQYKTYPLSLTLGTCGANFDKIAKVFIDWNGDGIFQAGELVATTGIINGTGTYTANVTVPGSVVPGNYSLMRVVLTETADSSAVKACGNYDKGETQDYRVQFLQTSTDAGAIAIVSPAAGGSCSGMMPVTVTIRNFGRSTLNIIPVNVSITDQNNVTSTFSTTYEGVLMPLAQDNVTFSTGFNISPGGRYIITATTNLSGDPVSSNNSVTDTVNIANSAVLSDLTANYCNNTKSYILSGSGDGELLWYQHSNDAIPFAYGSPAITATAPVGNTYYAGVNDFSGSVGPATKNVFTGGGYNQYTPSVSVSTKIPLVIQSARLYIGYPGKITFNVTNVSGEIVSSATLDVSATATNPQPGPQNDDPNDQGQVYQLGLLLPSAGTYSITAVYDNAVTIYRSNSGVTGYPFKIGNVFSITGNTASSATDTAYYKGFYYFFYDMKLKSPGCASASRQAVTVVKPVITQNGTTLTSNFATGNQWYLDGSPIDGAIDQNYSPKQSGNYSVYVTVSDGCVAQSDNFTYIIVPANSTENDIGLSVFPVPANDQLSVIFASPANAALKLTLVNSRGEVNYSENKTIQAGGYNTSINVSQMAPGTYVLNVRLGQKNYTKKVIIGR